MCILFFDVGKRGRQIKQRLDFFPIASLCIRRSFAYFRLSRQQIPFMPNGIVTVQEEHSERLSALGREGCIPNRYPLFSFICAFPQYLSIHFPVIKYFPAAFRCRDSDSSPKRGSSSQRCECVPNELKGEGDRKKPLKRGFSVLTAVFCDKFPCLNKSGGQSLIFYGFFVRHDFFHCFLLFFYGRFFHFFNMRLDRIRTCRNAFQSL